MAKKSSTVYRCVQCDFTTPTWAGRCPNCGGWGTLEKFSASSASEILMASGVPGEVLDLKSVGKGDVKRFSTGLSEVDRCLGGGIVPGSVILLGGDPGVGKSTLALQVVANLLQEKINVLYIAGEESAAQIKLRAERLEQSSLGQMKILPDSNLATILATASIERPNLLIVDSIQTVYNPEGTGVPGSVSQVSGAASKLVELAKRQNIATLLIGHVTKEGFIAGPKTLEHMVDVVLYLEGERFESLRLLRAVKNRFGGVNEVGVFEMSGQGLEEVANPSRLFLDEETVGRSGTSFTAVMEGSRVIACEIQALLSKSSLAYPKRTAIGFDQNRLWLLLAVLGKYGRLPVYENDVYVNVVGGLHVDEPAVDLAVAAAAVSSLLDLPAKSETAIFGELGLSGEIRPISQIERRLSEVERLGFNKAVIPGRQKVGKTKIELIRVGDIQEFLRKVFGRGKKT